MWYSLMEENNAAIVVSHLQKKYKLFKNPKQRMLYQLTGLGAEAEHTALEDISFCVEKGESFAVIGKNGSGKSTLLQILAGILKKTDGEMIINGKIAALLELGSGFDPESSGYDNIYMNAAILGVDKDEIDKRVNDIISFADIGDYIYQPVKTYSSGMFIRLGFAVAINVDADILLVDEALAVGDIFFRQKCYARLNELKEKGVTIVLVTHNMSEVEQFCDRAIYLRDGNIVAEGDSSYVVQQYYLDNQESSQINSIENKVQNEKNVSKENFEIEGWKIQQDIFYDIEIQNEITDGSADYARIGLFDEFGNAKRNFEQGEEAYFYVEIKMNKTIGVPVHAVIIQDQRGNIVHGKDTIQGDNRLPMVIEKNNILRILHKVKLDIAEGEYSFSVGLSSVSDTVYKNRGKYIQEELHGMLNRHCSMTKVGSFSVHQLEVGKPTRMLFHGMCDIPTDIRVEVESNK